MKKILAVLLLGLSLNAWADEASQRKAIDELFVQTNMENLLVSIRGKIAQQSQEVMNQVLVQQLQSKQAKDLNEAQQAAVQHFSSGISQVMDEMLAWDKYKELMAKVYLETFTEEEVVELTQFYKTPLGQKMLAKMPALTEASMRNMRALTEPMFPRMQQISETFADEFAKASDVKRGAEDKSKPAAKSAAKKTAKHAAE
ncbi:DUF2059 domain-containing protein [Uliginosibacterium gangwonense]|uniref:DUF2059 domain-containing protein n=1 Tax=Uliginosibacterium gangwonense TaxID=392736 RepID=UPI00036D68D7|nr:DUF2059 domain-containing protein [Uliginosibacterium gangwonense]